MEKPYHIVSKKDTEGLGHFLAKNVQALLPIVDLIEQSQMALDELIEALGRAQIEAILRLSAERVAGPRHPGKKGGAIGWHGREQGKVCLKERKLRVARPRLRKKRQGQDGEVPIPAYEAMQRDQGLGSRILEILLRGVSTRQYRAVLPEMAETVGVSRSSVSREAIEASEAELQRLCERRWDDVELLVIYLDGIIFGEHHVLVAVGVDPEGRKHVLGLWQGATENATVSKALLEDLVARGLNPERRYLFVLDGSKALRAAVENVFGEQAEVQRCQLHKRRNVHDHLPQGCRADYDRQLRNTYAMTRYADTQAALEKLFRQLERINPSAARSLEEGMEETLTLHRLGVRTLLRRSLATTNIIESCLGTVRHVARNVTRWQGGDHIACWTAAGMLEAEKQFRKVKGYRELKELAGKLNPGLHAQAQVP